MSSSNKKRKTVGGARDGLEMLLQQSEQLSAVEKGVMDRDSKTVLQDKKSSVIPRYILKIQPQPPRFPFVSSYFDCKIFLVDQRDTMKTGSRLPVEVTLLYSNGERVPNQDILEIGGGKNIVISTAGMAAIKIRIREVSMQHENRKFCLRFSSKESLFLNQTVAPVTSSEMTVIRHKLKICPSSNFPKTWYKDEGGRDKFIPINAVLEDHDGKVVLKREVPLRVILTYDGDAETEVKNQQILKLSTDSMKKIESNGTALLKIRIEEVSKNHQKQAFCVKIEPDTSYSPANYDIAMDVSPAITVKSKRNKRGRKDQLRNLDKKSKFDTSSHMAASAMLNMTGPVAPSPLSAAQVAKLQGQEDFGLVMGMIKSWTQEVVQGLSQMEWQHVGFEVMEGGQINLNRPLFRCPGCWSYKDTLREPHHQPNCLIAKPLQMYKRCAINENISRLVKVVQAPTSSSSSSSTNKTLAPLPPLPPPPKIVAAAVSSSSSNPNRDSRMKSSAAPRMTSPAIAAASSTREIPAQPIPDLPPLGQVGRMSPPQLKKGMSIPVAPSLPSISGMSAMSSSVPASLLPIPPDSRNISFGFLKGATDDVFANPPENEEGRVEKIMVSQTNHGFPAFDEKETLIGFYVYDDHRTVITFFPLAAYKEVTEDRAKELEQNFQDAKKTGRPDIVTKEDHVTLSKMKEAVMMSIFQIIEDARNPNAYLPNS
eukprot:jgi/Bigna1/72314/fgenesh1_pg.19_\